MNLVTRDIQNVNDLWWIWGFGQTEWIWSRFQAGGGFYESQWLTISHKPVVENGNVAIIDLSGNNQYDDPRNADRVTFDLDDHHVIFPKNIEYFDSTLDTTTQITWIGHYGATTDGSLDKLYADVGNHEFYFTTAIKDSSLHLGAGWDVVHLIDHRDVPDTQYWALIRRADNSLDAYSLLTGNRVRMEGGLESRNATPGNHNYGEVEILYLANSRNGGIETYKPGVDLPPGSNNRGNFTNIDLRSDGQKHSDSFNLAYFNFIRYTSDNVWVGEATIHDGTKWSTPSDRRVTTDLNLFGNETYNVDAPILSGQLSAIGQSRNGTHDLIVAEQQNVIDGNLRVYAFNVASGLYNEFNEVYLGTVEENTSDKSNTMQALPIEGSDKVFQVGAYGVDNLFAWNGSAWIPVKIVNQLESIDYSGVSPTFDRTFKNQLLERKIVDKSPLTPDFDGDEAKIFEFNSTLYAHNGTSWAVFTPTDQIFETDGKYYVWTSGAFSEVLIVEPHHRVALYGFGGNDSLKGGAGRDYIFGGQSVYNQLIATEVGNIVFGGPGADFFGVGNTNTAGVVTGGNETLAGGFIQGYGTDVINDWHAGEDTLVVLSNGVAVIGGLRDSAGLVSLNGNNIIDLRSYTAIATSDQNGSGARGVDGWDQTKSLDEIFALQATRDAASIMNEADVTVVNNGIIVSRGLGGNDTIYGSVGVDYIYGGDGTNYIYLGNDTAIDRVFVDQIIGKQVVREFSNNVDKIYLNVDALMSAQARWFGSDPKDPYNWSYNPHGGAKIILPNQPELVKDSKIDLETSFSNGRSSAYSLDLGVVDVIYYPWSEAYLGQLNSVFPRSNGAWVNNSHIAADLFASLALGLAGGAVVASGIAALQFPFTIPLGIALIAFGSSQIAAAATSSPHLNAVYKTPHHLGEYFVNDLTAAKQVTTSFGVDDTPLFTSFFWDDIPTRFAKAVEFVDTRAGALGNTNGITTFAVLRSNVETFIYFIQSEDHIITDDEARLVAEIEAWVPITDLVGYLGSLDIYNQTGVATPIFAQNVSLTVDVGTVSVSGRMKDASILLNITWEGNPSEGDTIEIFDGSTPLPGTTLELVDTIETEEGKTLYIYRHSFTPPNSGFEKVLNYKVVSKSSQGFTTSSETISLIYDNKAPEIVSVSPAGADSVSVVVTGNDISVNEKAFVRLMENGSPLGAPTAIEASGSSVSFTIPASGSLETIRTFTVEAADSRGNFVSHGTKIFALTSGNDGTNLAPFTIVESDAITFALAGDAYIDGTSGNDVLVLGGGTTRQEVDLKDGDDILIMPSSVVSIVADGGAGIDTVDFSQITQALNINLLTESFSFIVGGTPGTATISNFENVIGSQGNDVIIGTSAVNNLSGGGGNDIIFGGMGADVLTGGAGADIFAFNSSAESAASVSSNTTRTFDQITDFTSATDKIQLDAVGAIDFLSTATAVRTAVSVSNVADFAALVTELGTLTASTVSAAQVYDVTLTGTGLAASGMTRLVIVNDGDTGLDADDLMIHLSGTSSASILHSDFQFVA
jgi:Ca2+-binding RTX toxin-like protein